MDHPGLRMLSGSGNTTAAYCYTLAPDCHADDDSSSLWYVGVIISIMGSILSNLGLNTQKYSMIRELRKDSDRAYYRQPVWVLGFLMVLVGAIADFGALGFAAQSLVTPVGGFTMVANLFFAKYWLGEIISMLDLGSTALIIVGIILVAVFADKREQCYTLEVLNCLYKRKQFIAYAVLIAAVMIGVFFSIRLVRQKLAEIDEKEKKGVDDMDKLKRRRGKLMHFLPLMCAGLSGLMGAQLNLFAKSTIEILKSTARGTNEFAHFETYLIIICLIIFVIGQIHWLATALHDGDVVIVVPAFQAVFVVFTIFSGAAYFGEFENFNTLQSIMFPLGTVILIFGMIGLGFHKSRTAEDLLKDDALPLKRKHVEDASESSGSSSCQDSTRSDNSTPMSSVTSGLDHDRSDSLQDLDEFARYTNQGSVSFTPAMVNMVTSPRTGTRRGSWDGQGSNATEMHDSNQRSESLSKIDKSLVYGRSGATLGTDDAESGSNSNDLTLV